MILIVVIIAGIFVVSKLSQPQQAQKPVTTQTTMHVDNTPAPNKTDLASANENLAASFLLYDKYIRKGFGKQQKDVGSSSGGSGEVSTVGSGPASGGGGHGAGGGSGRTLKGG